MTSEHDTPDLPSAASPVAPAPPPQEGAGTLWRRCDRGLRRLLRWTFLLALGAYFAFGILVLVLRYVVLPGVSEWKDDIAAAASAGLGLPVSIEHIEARWSALRPRLVLDGVDLRDADQRPALHLERVEATFAWTTLLLLEPRFHRLELVAPQLDLRRETDGRILVGGVDLSSAGGSHDAAGLAWVLAQRTLAIRHARVRWNDALRGAPELRLDDLNFLLENRGRRHRFGLTARPPAQLAAMLDLRGDLRFEDLADRRTWNGQVYANLEYADLGGWRPWVDYPLALSGSGALRLWLDLAAGEPSAGTASVSLAGARATLGPDLPELALATLGGQLGFRRDAQGFEVFARHLAWRGMGEGVGAPSGVGDGGPLDFSLRRSAPPAPALPEGTFSARGVDLGALAGLLGHLPLDAAWRERLARHAPRGLVHSMDTRWRGEDAAPVQWSLALKASGLAWRGHEGIPGASGLALEFDGNQDAGLLRVNGSDMQLDAPALFADGPLDFQRLVAQASWRRKGERLELSLDNASFANADTHGTASGRYWPAAGGPGEIDFSARLAQTDGRAVWRYLPRVVNDDTRQWLRRGIVVGQAHDARFRLKGDLARFPFRNNEGIFQVVARIKGAKLDYGVGWPAIDDIDGELRFEGPRMRISAERGRIYGVRLSEVVAELPDLEAAEEVMHIRGNASGSTTDFLRFVSESPVARRVGPFIDGMRAEGNGKLSLNLTMPLRHVVDTRVKGEYRPTRNRLWVVRGLPPLDEVNGRVVFTENSLGIGDARARFLGEALQLGGRTRDDGTVVFTVRANVPATGLRREMGLPLFDHLSGSTPLQIDITLKTKGADVVASSSLVGLSSSLPAPLNKSATDALPLRVELNFPGGGGRERGQASLGDWARVEWVRRPELPGLGIERGSVGVNRNASLPEHGIQLALELPALDLDAWRDALAGTGGGNPAPTQAAAVDGGDWRAMLGELQLKVASLKAMDEHLHEVDLRASPVSGGWRGRIASKETVGDFDWQASGAGLLRARLQRLAIGVAGGEGKASPPPQGEALRELPGFDVEADDFHLRGMALGKLRLRARNQDGAWQLERLSLTSPDGGVEGSGRWQSTTSPQRTWLDFKLDTGNAGAYLGRLGYPATLAGGRATLTGKVNWHGSPIQVDYPSLNGKLDLLAEEGQFRRLDPGMGRLLGVLSLQSLPRRITLDFRDVFSEGFAFDRVSGSIDVDKGVMRTENLEIRGPAARVSMRGSTDLDKETQDLRVVVQPTLSESVAIGAAAGLINPVAGVITYLAQKTLGDPIEKLFSFEYAVTGRWDDPKVDKLGGEAGRERVGDGPAPDSAAPDPIPPKTPTPGQRQPAARQP